jgi:hypothetical protein
MQPSHEMPEEELVRARELVRALDDGASTFGLYPKQAQIGVTESGQTAIIMDFRVGELAFDDRVQAPEVDAEKDAMRELETEVVRDAGIEAFMDMRRRLHGEEEPTDGE